MKLIKVAEGDSFIGKREQWLLDNGLEIFASFDSGHCFLSISESYKNFTLLVCEQINQIYSQSYQISTTIGTGLMEVPSNEQQKVLLQIEQLDRNKLDTIFILEDRR